jgi:anti-sigma B factor antagonist
MTRAITRPAETASTQVAGATGPLTVQWVRWRLRSIVPTLPTSPSTSRLPPVPPSSSLEVRFSEALAEAEAFGTKQLTIDLAGVTFIDSTGLRALVGCRRRMRAAEGDVVLRAPSRQMKKLLEITGLDDFLTTVE